MSEYPRVAEELPEHLLKAFNNEYILKREDLNAEGKLACIMIRDEIINYLHTCIDERSY
ncbi:hypothetical protein [Veillonella intestinalis]|uniref:hypothetical protein n=1 Tax=Veillonella intestinalis TaxID=2941341 RepID=UPI00203C187F|nr:hypothetical protein [Veillonella intestinalis]